MVGQSLWKSLKALVDIDKQLVNTNEKIQSTKDILAKDHQEIPQLDAEIENQKENLKKEKKDIALMELKAKELKEREKINKKKLDKVSNPKEHSAIEKEIKLITGQLIEQDNLLMEAWHKLDELKTNYEQSETKLNNKKIQLEEGIVVQEKSLKDLVAAKEKLEKERTESIKEVPSEWLNKYERMRHKVDNPIVPVIGTSCSACYYSVLRQDMYKLKKSGVLLCRNCYRFLYYEKEEQEEVKQES